MKKLMYIALFLIFAAGSAAQENYVIDSVCVNTIRDYRMDGEKGSTYLWFIRDTLGMDIANPPYTDFRIDNYPSAGDTVWGSEINYVWDAIGEFDIIVLHYSVHGCDTIQQGRVKVFELPLAEAGDNQTVCTNEILQMKGDSAWNFSSMLWTTVGDGVFDFSDKLHPVYNRGVNDSIAGSVVIYLTVNGLAKNGTCTPVVDSVTIFFSDPLIQFSPTDLLCFNDSSGTINAEVINGTAPFIYEWFGPGGYTASTDSVFGLAAGWYTLKITDAKGCEVTDSVELFEPKQLLASLYAEETRMCETDTLFFEGIATGGTGGYTHLWSGDGVVNLNANNIKRPYFTGAGAAIWTLVYSAIDENGCIASDTVKIEVYPTVIPVLAQVDTLCQFDIPPSLSYQVLNSIIGTWSPDTIDTNTPGTQMFVFTPDTSYFCFITDTLEVVVMPFVTPLLAQIDTLCELSIPPVLPDTVLNGVTGWWSPDTISTSVPGSFTYVFTPDSAYYCFAPDSITIEIKESVIPLLAEIDTLCINDPAPVLPPADLNGINGWWSPNAISTAFEGTFQFVFTPDSSYRCYVKDTVFVTVMPIIVPLLADADTFCELSIPPPLPETDLNGIKGWWSPSVINTDLPGSFKHYFTPDSTLYKCFVTDSMIIEIIPNVVPLLAEIDTLCELSIPPSLPKTDLNGITGWWSPDTINTAIAGTYEFVFTPDSSIYRCFVSDTISVTVIPTVVPLLASIDTLCEFDPAPALPLADLNGITGWWSPDTIKTDVPGTVTYVFTPDSSYICYVPDSISVTVMPEIIPLIAQVDTLCQFNPPPRLLSTDLNGITGWWSPDTIQTDVLGDFDYIFTPDSSYVCYVPDTLTVTIMPSVLPVVAQIDTLCLNSIPPALPLTDINGIAGTWSPDIISTDFTGKFRYTFTPDSSYKCFVKDTIYIVVVPPKKSQFKQIAPLCQFAVPPSLPAKDLTGIQGTWWPSTIVTSIIGNFQYVFTPDPALYDCVEPDTMVITITAPIVADVSPMGPFCQYSVAPALPKTDNNGIKGTWLPDTINTDNFGDFEYVFIPDSTYGCFVNDTIQITILRQGKPVLDPVGPLCQFAPAPVLPATDVNSIAGTWFPNVINTDFVGSFKYKFTPDAIHQCYVADSIIVVIRGVESVTDTVLCQNSPPFLWNGFPIFSDRDSVYMRILVNGAGCDSLARLNVTIVPEIRFEVDTLLCETDLPFVWNGKIYPAAGNFSDTIPAVTGCDTIWTVKLQVTPERSPLFLPIASVLVNTTPPVLPAVSLNGIKGKWNPAVIDTNNPGTVTHTFIPDASECARAITMNITVEDGSYWMICPPPLDTLLKCDWELDAYAPFAYYSEFEAAGGSAFSSFGINYSSFGVSIFDDNLSCPRKVIRTYEVRDTKNNLMHCVQEIIIDDDVKPELSCPPGLTVDCLGDVPAPYSDWFGFIDDGGTLKDNCELDLNSFALVKNDTVRFANRIEIKRTYSIKDVCGNVANSCTQLFTVTDLNPPTLVGVPKNITVACSGDVPLAPTVTTSENYPVTYQQIVSPQICFNKYTVTRIWSAADLCGNKVEAKQIITVNDSIAPIIYCPPAMTYGGNVSELAALTGLPYSATVQSVVLSDTAKYKISAWDNCRVSRITYQDAISGLCPIVVTRTFRVYDACDNTSFCTQKISTLPTTIPVLNPVGPLCLYSVPPHLPHQSANGVNGTWSPDTIKTDVPGIYPYVFTPDASYACAASDTLWVEISEEIVIVANTVEDDATIRATGSVELVVTGGTAPYKYVWSHGEVGRKLDSLAAGKYFVTVRDAGGCEDTLTVVVGKEELVFTMDCPNTLELGCVDELLVNKPFKNYTEFVTAGGSAFSNCGIDVSTFAFVKEDTIAGLYCLNLQRTYTVSDSCGNQRFCDQLIFVKDLVPPQIVCPPDAFEECLNADLVNLETIAEFIAAGGQISDNCKIDSSSYAFVKKVNKLVNKTEIRTTYSITDWCGNISTCEHIVVVTDTVPPVANCTDLTVYLDKFGNHILTQVEMDSIASGSTDNCTLPEDLIIDVELATFNCDDIESGAEVKVIVTDEAGNSTECIANITVLDTIPPEAVCQDVVAYLDVNGKVKVDISEIDNGSSDNCAIDTMFITPSDFDCINVGDNPVTLSVIDNHGNISTCTANVAVFDTIAPLVSCVEPFIVQLDTNAQYIFRVDDIHASSFDECGIDTVYLDLYELDCDHIGLTTITVTAVDVNGNIATCETEVTVFGNIAPLVENDSAITALNTPVDIDVAANDYDLKTKIDLSTLQVNIKPLHGKIEKVLVNGIANGVMTYTPAPGFSGLDTLTYSICDDAIPCIPMCGTAIVYVRVMPENTPPDAVDDYFTVTCAPIDGNVLLNDSDVDKDKITVNTKPVKLPLHGEVTLSANGSFTYVPDDGFIGIDSFAYSICDDGIPSLCDTAKVYITKLPDFDCDGITDADDIDDDDDGILDILEGLIDLDGDGLSDNDMEIDSDLDGLPDYLDIDSDDDGIVDNIEGQAENNYIYPTGKDTNGNGWDDAYDPADGGYEFIPVDTDKDGMPDYRDIDSENDNVFDFIEGHDLNADGIPDVTRVFVDSDGDGLDDIYDTVRGWKDRYSSHNAIGSNAPLQDFDGNGTRDWRDINDENDEFLTINEDNNRDGDYSNDDLDLDGYPDYLDMTLDCELFIPEGFSPNNDGVHDFFQILCIQKYPNARLIIFNRNGNKLFEKRNYGNLEVWGSDAEAWWWGTSENRLTLGRAGGLPTGNYVYVLDLGNGEVKNGTVMIAY